MGKIKITEKQAKLLGIKEDEETGLKPVNQIIGDVTIRIAISGESVPRLKDRILQLIARHDPKATVTFFEATNKIVGNIKEIKLQAIKRDLISLDPTIEVNKSPLNKKLVKITKEQYNRLFASNILNESNEIKGGSDRINKEFKKDFSTKHIKNASHVSEDNFNITKPLSGVPKLSKEVGHAVPPMSEEPMDNPKVNPSELKKETLELIKYMYGKSEALSTFWDNYDLTYDKIINDLSSKGLILKKNDIYEVPKAAGSPQAAVKAIEDELLNLVTPKGEPEVNLKDEPVEPIIGREETNFNTESSNFPAGMENDSQAAWNEKTEKTKPEINIENPQLKVIAYNRDLAILTDDKNDKFVFNHQHIPTSEFKPYASLTKRHMGERPNHGGSLYTHDEDFNIDEKTLTNYINHNLKKFSKGSSIDAFNNGVDLVKIDEPLKRELISLYDKNKNIIKALDTIQEDFDTAWGNFKNDIKKNFNPLNKPQSKKTPEHKSKIVARLADLRDKEKKRREIADTHKINQDEMTESKHELKGKPFLGSIVHKMRAERAYDVSDKEIIRSLKDTVGGQNLIDLAIKYREEGFLTDKDIYDPQIQDTDNKEVLQQKYGITEPELYNVNEEDIPIAFKNLSDKELVKKWSFQGAIAHKSLTDGEYEIWASDSAYPTPHHLGYGKTEDEAWHNAAENIKKYSKNFHDIEFWTKQEVTEMTGSGSSGAFTPALDVPIIKREMPKVPVVSEDNVDEVTSAASSGPYDTNAFPNIKRDGTFVKESVVPKAHKTPQYPSGVFVKGGACTKLDNNKIAQNGGCNQGAGDAVEYTKHGGSIISPSLSEDEILEKVSKATGKTLDEVKRIITSKNSKA